MSIISRLYWDLVGAYGDFKICTPDRLKVIYSTTRNDNSYMRIDRKKSVIAALDSAATGSKELCTALDEAFRPNLAYVWLC